MKELSETLKRNLIADVENICCVNLPDRDRIALEKAFEITIGQESISHPDQEASDLRSENNLNK